MLLIRFTVANDSRYQIRAKDPRLLLVKDVDFDDSRSFICSAKNALNLKGVEQKITVHVKGKAKVTARGSFTDLKPRPG